MPTDKMWEDYSSLPIEAQKLVADFIAFLRQREVIPKTKKKQQSDLSQEPLVGMWRNREDIQDSTEWVRNLRKREWT